MVLHHVADRAGLIVKSPAALNSEILRHRDLHVFDVGAVQQRLEERVCEPRKEHAVHRPFAQVVVDAEDGPFIESPQQNSIQRSRRGEIGAERLLHDDARALRRAGLAELLHNQSEQHWRNRQIVGRTLGGAEFLPDARNVAGS